MPADHVIAGLDLDLLYPPFLEKLWTVLAACKTRGADYLVTEGFRSWGRSHQLAAAALEGGPRAAPAGLSGHNYGLAVDTGLIIRPSPHRALRWNPGDFEILLEECLKVGLTTGKAYQDYDHVELPDFVSAAQLAPLKKCWDANSGIPTTLERLRKVWDLVDKNLGSKDV